MNNFFLGKGRLVTVLLFLVAALLAALFLIQRSHSPYHALPSQTAVVLELNGLAKATLLRKNISDPAWAAVLETTAFQNAWRDATAAEQMFRHDAVLRDAFANGKMLAGLTLNKADSLHALFILDANADLDVQKLLTTNGVTQKLFPSVFRGHTLYTLHFNKHERLVVTAVGQLLLFSRFSYLVEDAINQLQGSSSWWADRKYLPELDENAPLRLFLRPAAVATQFENSMVKGWERVPGLLRENIEWAGLAWNGRNLSALAETTGFLGSMDAWGDAAWSDIFAILPDNTAFVARGAFDNYHVFFEKIKTAESGDFERFVLPWVGHEAACVVTEPFSPGMRDDQFIVLAVRDSAAAMEHLRDYGRERGTLRTEDYQTYEVFEFLSQSILKPLVEGADFRNPCCAMIGRYVVFANTRSALELWVDKYIVSQTAANNTDYLQLQQKLPATGGAGQVLLNANYLPLLAKNLFDADRQSFHTDDIQAFANTGIVGLNARVVEKNLLEVHLAAQSQQSASAAATSILWKTPLAALAATQPYVIAPGAEGDGAAIVVQDAQHELYRLNANGAVVWRRQMDGPILGAVQGIDFWGNQTVCYLFNTADRIWLINDKGRDVEGFPLVLQSPATNGVTVVDFDNNLKFNYFIACANGNVYGYDQFGRPLPGWNPQGGVGRVVHPVLHFDHGYKDYLVALNQAGKLFVFGRNGAERFPAVQLQGKNFGPPQADAVSKSPRIVCSNGTGAVFVCNLEGSVFNMQMSKSGGTPARLAFVPLSGDARHEYAVLKDNSLKASGYDGTALKTLFQAQLPVAQDTVFAVSEKRLGTLNRKKRQVFLLDGRGKVHPDFPLAGTTPFVISDLHRKNGAQVLVVGDGSSVYAYKVQ